jgi:putative transposase
MFVDSIADGERYLESWFNWYNHEHRHKGLNLHTPASVQFGHVQEVVQRRQTIMDKVYDKCPERFPKGRPIVKTNPSIVGINLRFKPKNTIAVEAETSAVAA